MPSRRPKLSAVAGTPYTNARSAANEEEEAAAASPALHRQPTASPHGTLLRGQSFEQSMAKFLPQRQRRSSSSSRSRSRSRSPPAPPLDASKAPKAATVLSTVSSPNDVDTKATTRPPAALELAQPPPTKNTNIKKKQASATEDTGSVDKDDDDAAADFAREPTMRHSADQLLPSPAADDADMRYTVVLDLDETVVYGRDGALLARAHLKRFLRTLGSLAEVVVWTAGERSYAKAVVREINTEGIIRHLVYRDDTWFDEEDYTKDLSKLGRDTDYVLIIENTPDCVRKNPENGIIVSDYEGATTRQDETLLKLAGLVRELVESGKTVPAFLATCRLLRRQTVEVEDREIPIFYLSGRPRPKKDGDGNDVEATTKVVRANRDKRAKPASAAADEREDNKAEAKEEEEKDSAASQGHGSGVGAKKRHRPEA